MVKRIFFGLVLIVGALVILISTRPSDFRITRTIAINAQPAIVFAKVNDFHSWQSWSPWAKLDPKAKSVFEGPAWGVGATMKWAGNDQVGVGSQTITETRGNDLIRIKLDFEKPFKASNTVEFTFKPQGEQTIVSWSMFGKSNFMHKAMSLFMNCDKMVGGQFERGLSQLKIVSEQSN